jgi:Ca2+-binding RTX toxin-like protein
VTDSLSVQDFIFPAPAGGGQTRSDEYDFLVSIGNTPTQIDLVTSTPGYDPYLEVLDTRTNSVIFFNDDGGGFPNSRLIINELQVGVPYKIRVTSFSTSFNQTIDNNYTLTVNTAQGDFELEPRLSSFINSQSGINITKTGRLDDKDFTFPAPVSGYTSLADEFKFDISVPNQPIKIALNGRTPGYDPFLQVINARTGEVVSENDDGGPDLDSLINDFTAQPGIDYRIRVTSFNQIVPDLNNPIQYTLEVDGQGVSVTLAERGVAVTSANVIWTTPTASVNDPGPEVPAPGGGNTVFVNDQGITAYVFTNAADNAVVPATAANLYIQALNGNDTITGTASTDNINGNFGADVILAGAGNDGDRTVSLPANTIRTAIRGGRGSDILDGQEGDDLLNGNSEHDTVLGGVGNDILRGGRGADVLDGGAGADYLIGDRGRDKLTGGADADIFVLGEASVAATSLNEADLITDFLTGTDKIMLPLGTSFAQLTLIPITVQVDGSTAIASTSIQSGATFYGLVQGITPVQLTETNFIAYDPNILILG